MDMHRSVFGKLDSSPLKNHVDDVRAMKKNPNHKPEVESAMPAAGVGNWKNLNKAGNVGSTHDVPTYQRYAQYNQSTNYNQPMNDSELIESVRNKIVSRGARGINGIKRVFKIMDDNDSKTLDFNEFKKALNDFRIQVPSEEYQRIFGLFDTDRSGEINYDEFLRTIVVSSAHARET